MDRINGSGTVDIGSGRRGFIDENLGVGQIGTEVTALWLNMTQEEMIKVIESAGLVLNPADWTQLWQALQILGLSAGARSRRWTAVISMTLSSAPGSPAAGDTYLVPTGATGIWATQVGKIAEWNGTAWYYFTPVDGHGISLPDGRVFERTSGTYVEKLALDAQSGKWNYAVAGGTANAITASLNPAPAALQAGLRISLLIANANTGSVTLNLNGLGATNVRDRSGAELNSGDLAPGIHGFAFDGTNWVWSGRQRGQLIGVRVFDTPGSTVYTPTPGTRSVLVEVQAGGGGGGGTVSTSTGSFASAGSGGAGGGYASSYLTSGFSGVTITVGAGGNAPVGSNGGNGGASSFGALLSATGGTGGQAGGNTVVSSTTQAIGGAVGGQGSGGNIVNKHGGLGRYALLATSPVSGDGGSSHFGAGAYYRSSTAAGIAGTSPGSGGSGASSSAANPSGIAGGAGAAGIVIVWEYA